MSKKIYRNEIEENISDIYISIKRKIAYLWLYFIRRINIFWKDVPVLDPSIPKKWYIKEINQNKLHQFKVMNSIN